MQPQYRGMLTASGTATVLGGVCLQFVIGSFLHWRTVAAISAIIPFLAFNAVFLVPESPYWLYSKNRVDDSQKSLQWLRGWVPFRAVQDEFQSVIHSVEDLQAEKKARSLEQINVGTKLKPFKKYNFVVPFILVMTAFIFGHFSGMTPLQTYAIQILGSYRVPINEYYATIFLGIAQTLGCLIGMIFVRSTGKRRLVFASFIGCSLCFFAVATQSHIREGSYQTDFKMYSVNTNTSIENLEQNVLHAIKLLNNRVDNKASEIINIPFENGTIPEYLQIGDKILKTSAYKHIDSNIFTEVIKFALHEINIRNFTEMNHKKLNDFLDKTSLVKDSDNIEKNHRFNTVLQIDLDKLFELLNITKKIILPCMSNEEMKISLLKIYEIEQIVWNTKPNETVNESEISTRVNEFTNVLQTFSHNLTVGDATNTHTDSNYQWIPMILLLCGSMFAHCGVKLFPWMLIGEVSEFFQMKILK